MSLHTDFNARIARIEAGENSFRSTFYVGIEGVYAVPARKAAKSHKGSELLENAAYPLSLVLAVLLGVAAHGIGTWLRYQTGGLNNAMKDPGVEMLAQVALASCIALVIAQLLGTHSREFKVVAFLGTILGSCFFHNLVHWAPEVFDVAFSPIWVSRVLSHTEPASILWLGVSFAL